MLPEHSFDPAAAQSRRVGALAELEAPIDEIERARRCRAEVDPAPAQDAGRIFHGEFLIAVWGIGRWAGFWRSNPLGARVARALLRDLAPQAVGAGHRRYWHTDPAAPPATPAALLALTRSTLTAAPPARPAFAALGAAAA